MVVGGQAKHRFDGRWDLDLWINTLDGKSIRNTQRLLIDWLDENPQHLQFGKRDALASRECWQAFTINVPDERVLYTTEIDQMEVFPETGIELLFGGHGLVFDEYARRSVKKAAARDLELNCLSAADIATLPRLKKYTSRG